MQEDSKVTLHYCDSVELVIRMVAAVRTTVSLVTCTAKFCLMNARTKKSKLLIILSPTPPIYCIYFYKDALH